MLNKKIFAIIFIISIIFVFSLGIYVGAFKIYPYVIYNFIFDEFKNENDLEKTILANPNFEISSIINIENQDDVYKKRSELIHFIFKDSESFFEKNPSEIKLNVNNKIFSDMNNLNFIDEFFIEMKYGVSSKVYLLVPENTNNKLIIYHHGHAIDQKNEKNTFQTFLNHGYAVLIISMPLTNENSTPIVDLDKFGKIRLNFHDDFIFLESENFSPLVFFIEPISSSLNYLDENYSFERYYMIGISGGGWATGVYSALDSRIEKSFPVAGTSPMFMKINNLKQFGDYEQRYPDFYNIANYLEQYIMASNGENRKQLQIFNKNDPCCFSGNDFLIYEDEVKQSLSQIGNGEFSIHIDENNFNHSISSDSLTLILNELEK